MRVGFSGLVSRYLPLAVADNHEAALISILVALRGKIRRKERCLRLDWPWWDRATHRMAPLGVGDLLDPVQHLGDLEFVQRGPQLLLDGAHPPLLLSDQFLPNRSVHLCADRRRRAKPASLLHPCHGGCHHARLSGSVHGCTALAEIRRKRLVHCSFSSFTELLVYVLHGSADLTSGGLCSLPDANAVQPLQDLSGHHLHLDELLMRHIEVLRPLVHHAVLCFRGLNYLVIAHAHALHSHAPLQHISAQR
mmetsp:Transcript_44556/g.115266  ORF Transcript_44556/g.115266 Transcript_44556/m.115266 type:complete len:250 (+) Transcript_44556:280-1029(+)